VAAARSYLTPNAFFRALGTGNRAAILDGIAALETEIVGAYLPTMNTQLVVPLPPMFSIANFFAFSTW
jgi:hypothetical protein